MGSVCVCGSGGGCCQANCCQDTDINGPDKLWAIREIEGEGERERER